MDNVFAYNVALNLMQDSESLEPKSIEECRCRCDWLEWQKAIQSELDSLAKREIFGSVVQNPDGVKTFDRKWILV